jgi:hypothetical protein
LRDRIRQAGNTDRLYYVVGAHMARVIEERVGRLALVATITSGPKAFFDAYTAARAGSEPKLLLPSRQ